MTSSWQLADVNQLSIVGNQTWSLTAPPLTVAAFWLATLNGSHQRDDKKLSRTNKLKSDNGTERATLKATNFEYNQQYKRLTKKQRQSHRTPKFKAWENFSFIVLQTYQLEDVSFLTQVCLFTTFSTTAVRAFSSGLRTLFLLLATLSWRSRLR